MEEFNLDMNNILSDEEYAAIVGDDPTEEKETTETEVTETEEPEDTEETEEVTTKEKEEKSTEVEKPESVGAEKETSHPLDEETTSPNTYSSIASAFKEDGVSIFSDVNDDDIEKIDSAEAFEQLVSSRIDQQVEDRLNDVQKRINEALGLGIEPDAIRIYENSLANLKAITNEQLEDEGEEGSNIRKNLIYRDYLNKGFTEERAKKEVQKSLSAGTIIEDAKESLQSNLDFYENGYKQLIEEAKRVDAENKKAVKQQAEALRKDILDGQAAFGNVEVDKKTRQKMYDLITKPVFKDADGNFLTELQKYESENHNDFMKYLAYAYVMTDGFKSLEKLEKTVERKATKKSISALEKALKSTMRTSGGNLDLVTGTSDTAPFAGGWTIDLHN